MKWINGYTKEEKVNIKKNWHKWFAWYPVTVGLTTDKRKIKEWLCYVYRKGTVCTGYEWMGHAYCGCPYNYFKWEYRDIKDNKI